METGRREKERNQRRKLLLEAASRVFGRKPFDEATMQEVAVEAEIGMQGLYEHFPSKQALYEAVMLHHAAAYHDRLEALLAGASGPEARLRAFAEAFVAQYQEHPLVLPMFIRDRSLFDWGFDARSAPRLRPVYEAERLRLREVVREAVAAGYLMDLDPDFLTALAMNVVQASLQYRHCHAPHETVAACVDRAIACLRQGVGGAP